MKFENWRKRVKKEYDELRSMGFPQGNLALVRMTGERVLKYCIPVKTPKLLFFDFRELERELWDNVIALMSLPQNVLYLNPQYLSQLDFDELWLVLIHEILHYYGQEHEDTGIMASHMVVQA